MVISGGTIRNNAAIMAGSLVVMPELAAVTAYALIMTLNGNSGEAFDGFMRGTKEALVEITEKRL